MTDDDARDQMIALQERIAEADLKHAEARVKALRARKAADKAEHAERTARAAWDALWDEYRALKDTDGAT